MNVCLLKCFVGSVLAVWVGINLWVGAAIAAENISGDWRCLHQDGDYATSRGVRIVGEKLIETKGFGTRRIVQNVIVSPNFVFWNGGELQEFEFNPQTMKLIETSRLSVKSRVAILEYKCENQ
mgnify:CR=1 FL=1